MTMTPTIISLIAMGAALAISFAASTACYALHMWSLRWGSLLLDIAADVAALVCGIALAVAVLAGGAALFFYAVEWIKLIP